MNALRPSARRTQRERGLRSAAALKHSAAFELELRLNYEAARIPRLVRLPGEIPRF